MTKFIFYLALLTYISQGCVNRQVEEINNHKESHFSYFEISYRGGWSGGFSFCVDSNKIFFNPSTYPQSLSDTLKYGILPDKTFYFIDSTIQKIISDSTLKSTYNYCDDCPMAAIKAIRDSDTVNVFQIGEINPVIWKQINELEFFMTSSKHRYIISLLLLETAKKISSSPPPPIK